MSWSLTRQEAHSGRLRASAHRRIRTRSGRCANKRPTGFSATAGSRSSISTPRSRPGRTERALQCREDAPERAPDHIGAYLRRDRFQRPRGRHTASSRHSAGLPAHEQDGDRGLSEVLFRRGREAAQYIQVHGQAVLHAAGACPADKCRAHDGGAGRQDRDSVL